MIAFVRGQLYSVLNDSIIIDVNGIGYQVYISHRDMNRIPAGGQQLFMHTFLQVSESEWKLYGFFLREELELFLQLQAISGMGARTALSILSAMTPGEFYRAVASQDEKSLVRIPGIGKKSAQRLLFEMKDKIGGLLLPQNADAQDHGRSQTEDLYDALEVLGYSRSEVLPLVVELQESGNMSSQVEENIKLVLKLRAFQFRK